MLEVFTVNLFPPRNIQAHFILRIIVSSKVDLCMWIKISVISIENHWIRKENSVVMEIGDWWMISLHYWHIDLFCKEFYMHRESLNGAFLYS